MLADRLKKGICSDKPRLFPQLLQLLANGCPVSPNKIATILNISCEDITNILHQLPSVEFDNVGNIVGFGLTLTPTPHHFHVGGHNLFMWCALDTLFFPAILNQSARVESPCLATGAKIQLTVTPDGVENIDPSSTVVSIIIPEDSETCCDVRGAFCNDVHFFSSLEASSTWLQKKQKAIILSVNDSYQLGSILIHYLFKE